MNDTELEKRKARSANETLVISQTEGGFRVYNPAAIANLYMVSGIPDSPKCNCPDFQTHQSDPTWQCKHVLAVLNQLEKKPEARSTAETPDSKEPQATQSANQLLDKKKAKGTRNVHSQMVIKRSVSPDGHIDSLSVEFLKPIDKESDEEIKQHAQKALLLQSEIVKSFLQENGNGKTGNQSPAGVNSNRPSNGAGHSTAKSVTQDWANDTNAVSEGAVPAQLLNIAGMNTRGGWKLFINVQVNGRITKLFGNKRELGEHITAAGFPSLADQVNQGLMLNLPCKVIAKPSPDGKYLNIERVMPSQSGQPNGRGK